MSYSALFTSGLSLASHPRAEHSQPSSPQINVHAGSPRPRLRRRRSSLTIATSPISAIKSPVRNANDSLRVALRSPRDTTFGDSLQNATRPKGIRRKPSVAIDKPCYPAPTSPLPTVPTMLSTSTPITPIDDPCPSSPITAESPWTSRPNELLRPSNISRKSSSLLPPLSGTRSRSSSGSGRGPLSPSPLGANGGSVFDMNMVVEEKSVHVPTTAWFDDDEDMKENDGDA